jgi:hypothetical protein
MITCRTCRTNTSRAHAISSAAALNQCRPQCILVMTPAVQACSIRGQALHMQLTGAFFTAPALLDLPEPLPDLLCPAAALLGECPLRCCMGLRLMKRVASSRKESRGPEQNWSSSDKLAAGASSRGRGLRMVEDAMTAAADEGDTSTAKQQTWCE